MVNSYSKIVKISSPSKKRNAITLEARYEVIRKVVKGGISKNEIVQKFDILPNTLGAILKKEEIVNYCDSTEFYQDYM